MERSSNAARQQITIAVCVMWQRISKNETSQKTCRNSCMYKIAINQSNVFETFIIYYLQSERNKLCDVCGKAFSTEQVLFSHRKTHVKTLEYECKECSKRFNAYSSLAAHLKLHVSVNVEIYANI